MRFSTAFQCIKYLNAHQKILLGLDRIQRVATNLALLPVKTPVIIVGGTNGKGTTVATLESIYLREGYRVGTFTSPYLIKPNEEIRINGSDIGDEALCEAFNAIFDKGHHQDLTYFEIFTLAALWTFKQEEVDVLILEVGLGGRLDAVNIVDAQLAIITSIDLDHMECLGNTRELIGAEKAGIFRFKQLAIYGDPHPPQTVIDSAKELEVNIHYLNRDFQYEVHGDHWHWSSNQVKFNQLPLNGLFVQNLSVSLMGIHLLQNLFPVSEKNIKSGLSNLQLFGRQQFKFDNVPLILDVAHNVASVKLLKEKLLSSPIQGRTWAIFSMLKDKDRESCIKEMREVVDEWVIAPLQDKRATSLIDLEKSFMALKLTNVSSQKTIVEAYDFVQKNVDKLDRIVVFGSFHTVGNILKVLTD